MCTVLESPLKCATFVILRAILQQFAGSSAVPTQGTRKKSCQVSNNARFLHLDCASADQEAHLVTVGIRRLHHHSPFGKYESVKRISSRSTSPPFHGTFLSYTQAFEDGWDIWRRTPLQELQPILSIFTQERRHSWTAEKKSCHREGSSWLIIPDPVVHHTFLALTPTKPMLGIEASPYSQVDSAIKQNYDLRCMQFFLCVFMVA